MRAILLLLILVPAASACETVPYLDIRIPGEITCDEGCEELPQPLQDRTFDVHVHWAFDIDECSIEGGVMRDEMVIDFRASQSNPAWLGFELDPAQVRIPLHEYYDAEGDLDPNTGRFEASRYVESELTVSFLRMPTSDEWSRVVGQDLQVPTYLIARAEGEGLSRDAFGVEAIAFDGAPLAAVIPEAKPTTGDDVEASAPLLPLVALGLLLLARRR